MVKVDYYDIFYERWTTHEFQDHEDISTPPTSHPKASPPVMVKVDYYDTFYERWTTHEFQDDEEIPDCLEYWETVQIMSIERAIKRYVLMFNLPTVDATCEAVLFRDADGRAEGFLLA